MKRIESNTKTRETFRPLKKDPMENRPTFDRFPEQILFPMTLYRMK